VVAGNKHIAERITESFYHTGIEKESYMPLGAESLAEAVLTPQECEDGVALINLGATTTTLAIYTKGALQALRIVPFGSRNITKDIQEIGISEKYAEKLKIKIGTTLESLVTQPSNIKVPNANAENEDLLINTSFLATIIEARLDEITEPILKTIDRYKKELGAGIMLSGGGAAQNNIVEYFENRTEMYVQISNHTAHLTANSDEKYFHPMFAQLIGTVLLANANQKENPVEIKTEEPKKTPKLIQRVKQTIENLSINFFETDNKM
jgi:cell division protein FtsA